jgi:hypothetical protein
MYNRSGVDRLTPGSPAQTALLYVVACQFEVALRKWLSEDILLRGEAVSFYDTRNKLVPGEIVVAHPPVAGQPHRFDIQSPVKGSDKVLYFSNVNRNRIHRPRKYLGCDEDWLKYAARTTGFYEGEVNT